jgi:hypothetical protein
LVLDKAKYITDVVVSECDVEMVSKHMDEILEVYKGIPDLPPGSGTDELE